MCSRNKSSESLSWANLRYCNIKPDIKSIEALWAEKIQKCAYISGDTISHMSVSGREKPWESKEANNLVWRNIKDLAANFLDYGCDVIVDWIIIWEDLREHLDEFIENGIEVRYAVLWADEKVHVERDKQRPVGIQMGERVLVLRDEFKETKTPDAYFIDNTDSDMNCIIDKILHDETFLISNVN